MRLRFCGGTSYTGEQWDPNAGFYYLRARWYEPGSGRFTSVDPYEGDPQAPSTLHRYLYANANPIYYHDPEGEGLVELMTTVAIRAITFTVRHPILMGFVGFAVSVMIPEEAQLSLMGSGNPAAAEMGAWGNATARGFRLIKSDLIMRLLKTNKSLAGKFWYYYGNGFQNLIGKYLLNNAPGPVMVGSGKFSADYFWQNMLVEVKTSLTVNGKQLAAISRYAKEWSMQFCYIFERKPPQSTIDKVTKAGGKATWLWDD